MSRKRIKQYLMLLLAIGVIAVVASGSGTFASFNAEVTNGGNTFATGSLILNNTHGTTTCTSAFGTNSTSNQNQPSNGAGVNCSTLFNNVTFTPTHAVANGTSGQASITLTSISASGVIYNGDKLVITPTSGPAFTVTTANTTPVTTATTVALTANLGSSFTGATVLDATPTSFADVTLQNAGTINANDITVKPSGCNSSYGEGSGTLGSPVTAGQAVTQVPFSGTGTFASGEPVVVSDGTNAQTFIATGPPSGGNIPVQSGQNWNFAYAGTAKVSGPQFNGNSANDLCAVLRLSITEESSSPLSSLLSNASSCVYGGTTAPANTNACDLTAGTLLTSSTAATLGNGLNAGASRYFELAVHVDGTNFDNTYQNTKTSAFSLTWHIDQ